MSLTVVSSNVAGFTKKQLTGAVVFTGFCIGNIVGPQTFISKEAREAPALMLSSNRADVRNSEIPYRIYIDACCI